LFGQLVELDQIVLGALRKRAVHLLVHVLAGLLKNTLLIISFLIN